MRYFRCNIRFGAFCALFALAVQLLLSFSHVHGGGSVRLSAYSPLSIDRVKQPTTGVPDDPAVPSNQTGLAGDYCAICALIKLAGAVVPAAGPVTLAPDLISQAHLGTSAGSVLTASSHLLFQARAPPLA
jgi:hypothetical protein